MKTQIKFMVLRRLIGSFLLLRTAVRIFVIIVFMSISVSTVLGDALGELNSSFKVAYNLAVQEKLREIRETVPLFVNRFGEIALFLPNKDDPIVFSMNSRIYLEARTVAHTALAIYSGLAPLSSDPLSSEKLEWLRQYRVLLRNAKEEVEGIEDIPSELKSSQLIMLTKLISFCDIIIQKGVADEEIFSEIGRVLNPLIKTSLSIVAKDQLEQFRTQIAIWRREYPKHSWENSVVVVIGIHQARELYLQRQFFDWLLKDNPNQQNRVVYAEVINPPGPLEKEVKKIFIELLAKVMLDKEISAYIFDDPLVLQSDVLGPAAREVISSWP